MLDRVEHSGDLATGGGAARSSAQVLGSAVSSSNLVLERLGARGARAEPPQGGGALVAHDGAALVDAELADARMDAVAPVADQRRHEATPKAGSPYGVPSSAHLRSAHSRIDVMPARHAAWSARERHRPEQ